MALCLADGGGTKAADTTEAGRILQRAYDVHVHVCVYVCVRVACVKQTCQCSEKCFFTICVRAMLRSSTSQSTQLSHSYTCVCLSMSFTGVLRAMEVPPFSLVLRANMAAH